MAKEHFIDVFVGELSPIMVFPETEAIVPDQREFYRPTKCSLSNSIALSQIQFALSETGKMLPLLKRMNDKWET